MRIEDLNVDFTTKKIDEKNWNVETWRKENPVDYFKCLAILLKSDKPVVTNEIFQTIYKIMKLYIPDTLYKYYSLNSDSSLNEKKFKTLCDKKVYLSDIKDFNDPFDSKGFYYKPAILSNIERLKSCKGRIVDDFSSYIKGTCFTANGVQSMPMWAHYGNNHRGFCISYNMKENADLTNFIFPIQYTEERLDITSFLIKFAESLSVKIDENSVKKEKHTMIDDLTIIYIALLMNNIKHPSWSYENEFRCTMATKAKGMPYTDAIPEAIYIGMNCEANNRHKLISIADYLGIPVFQMEFDEENPTYNLVIKSCTKKN